MKVLSVKQPWAYLLVSGIKDIENRPRRTHFRGHILIHASAKPVGNLKNDSTFSHVVNESQLNYLKSIDFKNWFMEDFAFGAIIGSVEIVDCVENHPSIWAAEGQYHYVIANPILFDTPMTGIKGQLGLWNYDIQICGLCGQPFGPSCVE